MTARCRKADGPRWLGIQNPISLDGGTGVDCRDAVPKTGRRELGISRVRLWLDRGAPSRHVS
ncbi:protein of unknown function [Nitrospira japonica]|uniref:Uncharacterized protein n=1 Tax=Nitrospira japonica TaxID=1325564 RepID=A0A1W1I341_9BACT|nr:protein of unknown function [Nitrospira japonica]